ncbi:hypothetical protein [Microbacterium sp.]|uniref:hypothetical protein n=1 Tax=Microbacterium sp. TaxID=51671 RepID=UPI0028117A29|nr:hypothetical protein [Microbacterium sp.]
MAFDVIDGPRIVHRQEAATLGIRLVTPFRGMLGVRDQLIAELAGWLDERRLQTDGPFFLRLHQVDMSADMEIEVGVFGVEHAGDGRVRPGVQPSGDYALLAYRGSSLQANRLLLGWGEEVKRSFLADPVSGAWVGRFEIIRTDPRLERRKTAWAIELAFLLEEA